MTVEVWKLLKVTHERIRKLLKVTHERIRQVKENTNSLK
jgi:hypothetical protein